MDIIKKYLNKEWFFFNEVKSTCYILHDETNYDTIDIKFGILYSCKMCGLGEKSGCNDCVKRTFHDVFRDFGFIVLSGYCYKLNDEIAKKHKETVNLINKYKKMSSFNVVYVRENSVAGWLLYSDTERDIIAYNRSWAIFNCEKCGISIDKEGCTECRNPGDLRDFFIKCCRFEGHNTLIRKKIEVVCTDVNITTTYYSHQEAIKYKENLHLACTGVEFLQYLDFSRNGGERTETVEKVEKLLN
jgi:hypothetical protein